MLPPLIHYMFDVQTTKPSLHLDPELRNGLVTGGGIGSRDERLRSGRFQIRR